MAESEMVERVMIAIRDAEIAYLPNPPGTTLRNMARAAIEAMRVPDFEGGCKAIEIGGEMIRARKSTACVFDKMWETVIDAALESK